MKKIVKIKERKEVEIEVEVEFPIYARHDIDGDGWSHTIFMRRDEDGTTYAIKQDGDRNLEIEIHKYSLSGSSADYILGRGEYESSAIEFNKALERARKFLARCFPEPAL